MTNISFIYFDLGGVVFHWKSGLKAIANEHNIEFDYVFSIFKKYDDSACRGTIMPQDLWNSMADDLNIERDEHKDFLRFWADHFIPIKETQKLIVDASSKYSVGIATNQWIGTYNQIVERNILPEVTYGALLDSSNLGVIKPELDFFHLMETNARVDKSNILFIDDSLKNISAAKVFGFETYLFDSNDPLRSTSDIRDIVSL